MLKLLASLEKHHETVLYFVPGGDEVGMITLKGNKIIKTVFPNTNKNLSEEAVVQHLTEVFGLVKLTTGVAWNIPLCVMYEVGLIAGRYHFPQGLGFNEIMKLYDIDNSGFNTGIGETLRKCFVEESCGNDAALSGEG